MKMQFEIFITRLIYHSATYIKKKPPAKAGGSTYLRTINYLIVTAFSSDFTNQLPLASVVLPFGTSMILYSLLGIS